MGRRFSVSEGSNAFYMSYTDVTEQQLAEEHGNETIQKRITIMKLIRKPGYDLGITLLLACVYLGVMFAMIIMRDYVFEVTSVTES